MHIKYIPRNAHEILKNALHHNPVVAMVGPRQCGKSTLAKEVIQNWPHSLYLDLELPSDLRKLEEPEWFLREHKDRLICLDEIQRCPDLFPLLRALVDQDRRPGRFLILGSASRDLIRQEGESLAGRIHYLELAPLHFSEVIGEDSTISVESHWWRGGFPLSLLAPDNDVSRIWLRDFIQTYCTRDLPDLGFSIPAVAMERCWRMIAHSHGSTLNSSKLGQAMDVSHNTIRRYLDLLEQSFMVRALRPVEANTKKRLVKSPKVYVRDSGILHALLEIESFTDLFGHPVYGASWEGWCIEQICQKLPNWRTGFYRDSSGAEIDLILEKGPNRIAIEFKASLSPKLSRGNGTALEVLKPTQSYMICPMRESGYSTSQIFICGIEELLTKLNTL